MSEDYDLWLRAILRGASIENVKDSLLKYRIHGSQVSGSRLGYSEVAGYWLREFCLKPSMYCLFGLVVAIVKVFLPFFRQLRK